MFSKLKNTEHWKCSMFRRSIPLRTRVDGCRFTYLTDKCILSVTKVICRRSLFFLNFSFFVFIFLLFLFLLLFFFAVFCLGKFQGQLKQRWNSREFSRKTHMKCGIGSNQKNVWFVSFTRTPKILFKFPRNFWAEEWTFLNSSCKFIQWHFLRMLLQHMFWKSVMLPLEWWIKWAICEVLYKFSPCCHFKFFAVVKLHDPVDVKLV